MEQFIYAQLDENNVCIGVSYLSGLLELPNMLRLNEEENVLGKKYNKGVWEEVEPVEPLPTLSTEQEPIQAQLLLDQAQILANQRTQDEVLAIILLEQIGGGINV